MTTELTNTDTAPLSLNNDVESPGNCAMFVLCPRDPDQG